MSKFFALARAMFSQDMNPFRLSRRKAKTGRAAKIALIVVLAAVVMLAAGSYALLLALPLAEVGLTFIMLTIFLAVLTLLCFVEGVYKSQSMLFDCRDNDLLLALPIKKRQVLTMRVLKLLVFQIMFNALFLIPAFVVYACIEQPGPAFYALSALMLILMPLIPTALAVVVGYIVRALASRFRAQKFWQIILSLAAFLAFFWVGMNANGVLEGLVANAGSINELLTRIYYPIGIYLELIQNFNLGGLLMMIAVNVLPMVLVVIVGAIGYFRVISRVGATRAARRHRATKARQHTPLGALLRKELRRYFASPVYVLNTLMGLVLLVIFAVLLVINGDGVLTAMLAGNADEEVVPLEMLYAFLPVIFFQIIVIMSCMTSITSSSISIEGRSINLTKTLPATPRQIFWAKILMSDVLVVPVILLADAIFLIKFLPGWGISLEILLASVIFPTLTAVLGLLVNLRLPKLDATSDAEVIKQSMSMGVSLGIGLVIAMAMIMIPILVSMTLGDSLLVAAMAVELIVGALLTVIAWAMLRTKGEKWWHQLTA